MWFSRHHHNPHLVVPKSQNQASETIVQQQVIQKIQQPKEYGNLLVTMILLRA